MASPGELFYSTAVDELRVDIVSSSARPDVEQVWRRLESNIGNHGLTCSWAWTSTWLDAYGSTVPHWFAIGRVFGRPIGAVLLTCSSLPSLGRRGIGVIHLGTAGEPRGHSVDVECNRLLVQACHRAQFLTSLLETVEHELHPVGIRMKSFLPSDIASIAHDSTGFTSTSHPCPTFDLDQARADGNDVLAQLRSSVRSRVRRSNKELAPLKTEWGTSADHALDIFDELVALHQVRWRRAGRPGAFSSERFERFHRMLIETLFPLGQVILFRVRHDDHTVGCLYSFIDNGMVMFYQSGLADFDNNKIKPGLTTHVLCMEQCLERELHTYNFLAGDQRYKSELATGEQELMTAHAWRHSFVEPVASLLRHSGALDQARRLKRWRERIAIGAVQ